MTTPETCVVRVLDSSWDECKDLLEAFRFAQNAVDKIPHMTPIFADVYDRHGLVARIQSDH